RAHARRAHRRDPARARLHDRRDRHAPEGRRRLAARTLAATRQETEARGSSNAIGALRDRRGRQIDHGGPGMDGRRAFGPTSAKILMGAVLCALLASGLVGNAEAQAKPEGEMRWALYVTVPPAWLDPGEVQGFITPFWVQYALHDALVKPMP